MARLAAVSTSYYEFCWYITELLDRALELLMELIGILH